MRTFANVTAYNPATYSRMAFSQSDAMRNVTITYSISVVNGVTDDMINDLNQALLNGNFTTYLSNYTLLPLKVEGAFSKVQQILPSIFASDAGEQHATPLHLFLMFETLTS